MSREVDRVAVPTNGRGPQADPDEPSTAVQTTAFTPTQLAVGFGIVASLILLLLGRRRGRRG